MGFIEVHIEAIASIVTIVSAIAAILKRMLAPMKREITDIRGDIAEIRTDIKELKAEQMKFHTRLTWLEGYLVGHDPNSEKRGEN